MTAFHSVGVNVAACIFLGCMANRMVTTFPCFLEAAIGGIFIRHQTGAAVHFLSNCSLQRCRCYVSHHATPQLAAPFYGTEHRGLIRIAPLLAAASITRLSGTYIHLIAF